MYFDVGSSSNANPDDRTFSPPRAVIMAVNPDGSHLRVVETGVRNGEGLAVAPDGSVWTAVNNRDNVRTRSTRPTPQARLRAGDPGLRQRAPARRGRPGHGRAGPRLAVLQPRPGPQHPAGSLADVPFVADAVTNAGPRPANCATLPPVEVGLPAHSAPLGMSFLEGSTIPAPWSGGAVVAVHGSWDRQPPRAPAVLWMAWDAARHTLRPAVTLVSGFQERRRRPLGSSRQRGGGP